MKKVFKKSRHLRWNWEESPDNSELVRYHFIVIGDKNREGIMRSLIQPLLECGFVDQIRSVEGKVVDSKFRYLFRSYDSNQKPSILDLTKSGKLIRKDPDLYERQVTDIEDYVANLYEL